MTAFLHIVRFVLPTLFFGYGIAANLAVLMGPPPEYALPDDGLLSGGLTRDIDGLYKEKLPHMDLSYGLIGAARYALLQEARSGAVVGKDGWLFSSEEARADVGEKALTGDLIRFVTTSTLAARVGLPSETFVPIVQTPLDVAGDIFGAAAADIVLIGTSYSANSDWGFADALMLALGRDVLSMAEQGKGPLQPMQDYLNSAGFKDAPPKVVIWEIPVRFLTDPAIWPGPALSGDAKIANLRPSEENPDG